MKKIILSLALIALSLSQPAHAQNNTTCLSAERWDGVLNRCVSTLSTSNSASGFTNDGRDRTVLSSDVNVKDDAMDPLSTSAQTGIQAGTQSNLNRNQSNAGIATSVGGTSAGGTATIN